ncbi:IS66 family transposase [Pseudomonas orientalis]|uniref:IS66 family transposase n=1 Tax=Pseudomonas orientalis TaxID=76758 RepID=UPI0009EA3B91
MTRRAPLIDALHIWKIGQRQLRPEGSAIAKASNYSLKHEIALLPYLEDGDVPFDNNCYDNPIRPCALGCWSLAGI